MKVMSSTHSGLEFCDFVIRQSICLGNDGNKVDFGVQPTHELNIEGFQAMTLSLRVCTPHQ